MAATQPVVCPAPNLYHYAACPFRMHPTMKFFFEGMWRHFTHRDNPALGPSPTGICGVAWPHAERGAPVQRHFLQPSSGTRFLHACPLANAIGTPHSPTPIGLEAAPAPEPKWNAIA